MIVRKQAVNVAIDIQKVLKIYFLSLLPFSRANLLLFPFLTPLFREALLYETEADPYKVRTHIRRTFYYSPDDMNLQMAIDRDLLAFVFVRHPFSRLVSGKLTQQLSIIASSGLFPTS